MNSIQQISIYDCRWNVVPHAPVNRQPIQSQKARSFNTILGWPVFTAGTINGACSPYLSPSAAEVPATCFAVALMAMVQALSCVLWKHLQSESSLQHENVVPAHPQSALIIPDPPVLLADLGALMNAKVLHIRAQTYNPPSNARGRSRRLPLLLIIYKVHVHPAKFLSKRHSGC